MKLGEIEHRFLSDMPLVKLKLLQEDTNGQLFQLKEFISQCLDGVLTDADGSATFIFYINKSYYYSELEFQYSIDDDIVYYAGRELASILPFSRAFKPFLVLWHNK